MFDAFRGFARLALVTIGAASTLLPGIAPATAQSDLEKLRAEFAAPPAEARPWTWFHVMSGNMTREGITKDLEAIERVGIGGIVLFHVTQGISYGPVKFNSPDHLDLIEHVAAECERLGLKFTFHNADGWSSTAGPWISPEQSMKRLVWSEAIVAGGTVSAGLRKPGTVEGFYRDIAVVAYPSLSGEIADHINKPVLSSSDPDFDLDRVTDGEVFTQSLVTASKDEPGWVQFSYDRPVPIRKVSVGNVAERDIKIALQVSDDGINFKTVREFKKTRLLRVEWEVDAAFAPIEARHFRVTFDNKALIGEIELSQLAQVANASGHSGMGYVPGNQLPVQSAPLNGDVIRRDAIRDLTQFVGADGRLQTTLPEGQWTVMRFGYTSTGARNVNPSPEGNGLEVDKFDASAFGVHYDAFIAPVIRRARAVAPAATAGVMIDSYEVGGQNWTQGYDTQFQQSHGIDLKGWLPIYAGRFVSSAAATTDMFAKIRSFNAQLINDNYYGEFARLMEQEGLESLIQPYGLGPFDELNVASVASIPAGEFWVRRDDLSNLNGAVSAGRIYGKPVIAAEAFTAVWDDNWFFDPAFGKKWGDRAWVAGVNQFFFHRFAHQANTHVMPGMTMNRWGSHFDRTQPWWDKGGAAWFGYMARGQHMLRQGRAVSDVAMAIGSNSPVICPQKSEATKSLPVGTEFDCVDTPTLLHRSRFEGGALVLESGARYSMIWWPHSDAPSAAEAARLDEAKRAGVAVAFVHRGDVAADVFEAAGLKPRVSSVRELPSFTHRKVGESDIFFVFNDSDESRRFDLCFRVNGKRGEEWHPVSGGNRKLAGSVDAGGCTNIVLDLAPYESRFVVFDNTFEFAPGGGAPYLASKTLATLDQGWSINFDPAYGDADDLTGKALFDWSKSDNPEIHHFSGKATYRTSFELTADEMNSASLMALNLGQVETVANVRVNGQELGAVWTAPYAIDISTAVREGRNVVEIEVANLWVNRLIGDAALPDTSGYEPEYNIGYRPEENLPKRDMVEWYSSNRPPPLGPRRTFATHSFQKPGDPLIPSGLIGPVTVTAQEN
ncbi:glycoside hydrolase [Erythrobacter insulae]|uniref:Glycoside hydrolase n=1 Tax=Erythrobacter insulae TaxID=2584124 RepID=A0A547PD99_9SPHN|nr:glycosyl hydrolase [Erythrobacter insulae]TRD12095.1 glycoside hydrolase [Erythrobacter insulae]